MLSGDVFSRSPIRYSLFLFKMFYYFLTFFEWRHVLSAYRIRRQRINQVFDQETLLKDSEH